jgi:hypothetical protein
MLEEHGVRVHVPDQGVVLSMVASGKLDGIRAAVEQLGNEFPRSGSVIIEGEDRDRSAENGRATALSYDIAEEARAAHRAQAQEARRPTSGAARRQDAPGLPGDTAQPQEALRPPAGAAQPQDAARLPGDTAQPQDALPWSGDTAPSQEALRPPRDAAQPQETPQPSADVAQPQDAAQPPSGAAQLQDAVRRLDDPDTDEVAAITARLAEEAPVAEPAQPQAEPRRCTASTAKGPRCRLIAQPDSATCAVHSRHALPAAHPVRPMRSPDLPCRALSRESRELRVA